MTLLIDTTVVIALVVRRDATVAALVRTSDEWPRVSVVTVLGLEDGVDMAPDV